MLTVIAEHKLGKWHAWFEQSAETTYADSSPLSAIRSLIESIGLEFSNVEAAGSCLRAAAGRIEISFPRITNLIRDI
jgi:hypothetical protein